MTDSQIRLGIAAVVLIAFVAFMVVILMGVVNTDNTEIAKMVGAIFGYLTGLVSTIFARYFKIDGSEK